MQYLIVSHDGSDAGALDRRMAARSAHIELGDTMREQGSLHFAAAILDDNGKMIGSMLVTEFPGRTELDAWLEVEPYMIGKVWESVDVQPCKVGPSFDRKMK